MKDVAQYDKHEGCRNTNIFCRWLGRAMVLGSFQCRGVLLLWNMVGQGPAVLAAGAGQVLLFLVVVFFFFCHLVYPIFLF